MNKNLSVLANTVHRYISMYSICYIKSLSHYLGGRMLTVNVDTSHGFVKISTNKMHKIAINPQQYRLYLCCCLYLCCSVVICVVLYCCLCVNVFCHRVTTQLQLINISYHNTSTISTRCSNSLSNNSFRYTYSVYTEESHQF
jgi:hypothetical protein